LEDGKLNKADHNLVALRILIAPFTLRRTMSSVWEGTWVIDRHVTRPTISIVKPYPDDLAETASTKWSLNHPRQTEHSRIVRADHQRLFAWSPCYQDYLDEKTRSGASYGHESMKIMNRAIATNIHDSPLTGRLMRFIAGAKYCKDRGETMIVACERLFPLALIFYVTFPAMSLILVDMQTVHGFKGWGLNWFPDLETPLQ
jgi:hypothetical protein